MSEATRAAEVLAEEFASHHMPSRMIADRVADYLDDGEKCVAALLAAVPEGPGVVILRDGGELMAMEVAAPGGPPTGLRRVAEALSSGGLSEVYTPDAPTLFCLSRPPSPKGEQ